MMDSQLENENDQPGPKSSLWSTDFLKRHKLLGHAYKKTGDEKLLPFWQSQKTRSEVINSELFSIGREINNECTVYLINGFMLMGQVYRDHGERYMADIDLLVDRFDLWKITDVLKMYGYEKRVRSDEQVGYSSEIYTKQVQTYRIKVEVFTQLEWQKQLPIQEKKRTSTIDGLSTMSVEHQLLHMCSHIALKSGYKELYELMDVYKYTEKYKGQINWEEFWKLALDCNVYKACFFTLFLCQKMGLNIQPIFFRAPKRKVIYISILKKLVSFSFLYDPSKYPLRRRLVLALLQDSAPKVANRLVCVMLGRSPTGK